MDGDIPKSFGALLIGGLYASLLSGFVCVQVVVYFKLYPGDGQQIKTLVLLVWLLDVSHTAFIWSTLWSYLIDDFGISIRIDTIHWTLAMTVLITAILTFSVHLFFAHRIFMLSRRNYWLACPIITLAFLRLFSAAVSTAEMLHLKTFSRFEQDVRWVFAIGLALSTTVDVLITGSLFVLLHSSRTGAASLNAIIDGLIQYTLETGALTCAGTVVAMICWLAMPHNLIFMGLHFVINKLYANSLLVTLNMREKISRARLKGSQDYPVPAHALGATRRRCADEGERLEFNATTKSTEEIPDIRMKVVPLEINVERNVHYAR